MPLADPVDVNVSDDIEVAEPGADPEPPARHSVWHNILVIMGSQVTTWVVSTALLILVPRFLGPVGIGQLRVSQSLWVIVNVFVLFGTATMLTVEVAKRNEQALPLTRSVIRLRMVLLLLALPFVAGFVFVADYERVIVAIVAVSVVPAAFGLVGSAYRAALLGLEQMRALAWVDVISEFTLAVIAIAVLALGGEAISWPIVAAVVALFTAVMFRRGLVRHTRSYVPEPSAFHGRGLVRQSSTYLFADSMIVVYLQLDTLVISLIASEQEVGWYTTADTIFGSLLFVPAVLLTAVFPRMARMHHEDPAEMRRRLEQSFRTILVIGVWIGLGTVVVSTSLTKTFFGPEFSGSAAVLAVFGLVAILGYQTILLGQYAVATERAKFVGYIVLLASVLTVPLDLVLVSWTRDRYDNGAIGAAMAYLFTEGIQVVLAIAVIARHLVSRRSAHRALCCAVAGAAMLLAGWPLRHHFFVISGTVVTIVFFAVLFLLRAPDEFERRLLRQAWRRIGEKLRPSRPSQPDATPAA